MGEGSASRPDRSLPPGKTRYPLYRRLGGPQSRYGQVRKILPAPGFDPRTIQRVASRYTGWATRPTCISIAPTVTALVQTDLPFQHVVNTKFKYTTNEMFRVPVYHRILWIIMLFWHTYYLHWCTCNWCFKLSLLHLLFNGYQGLFLQGWSSSGMKLISYRHLAPRLRISGTCILLSLCVIMAWTHKILPFHL